MNRRLKHAFLVELGKHALPTVFAAMLVLAPAAHADTDQPSLADLVCQQLALGHTPEQITEQLHAGDPRFNNITASRTVWDAIIQHC